MGHQQTTLDTLDQLLQERDVMLDELQFNIVKVQHRMQKYADKKRRDVTYEEGDLVYLKLKPYR